MQEPEPLQTATDDELEFSLAFVLRHHGLGKANKPPTEIMARIIAKKIIGHLRGSRFVVMKRPPAAPSGTPHKV